MEALAKKLKIKNYGKMTKSQLQKAVRRAECKAQGLVYDAKTGKCRKSVAQKRAECKAQGLVYDAKTKKCRKSKNKKSKKKKYQPAKKGQMFDGDVNISRDCKISNDFELDPLTTHSNIKKKIYKNWNGTCFDIDDLAGYLIANNGKNADPMRIYDGVNEPLWRDKDELKSLLKFSKNAITNKERKNKLVSILNTIYMDLVTPPYIAAIEKNISVFNQIFLTGCTAIADNPSSYKIGIFSEAVESIGILAAKIDELPLKVSKLFLNLKINTGKTLQDILSTSNITCIHGIGIQICSIYFQNFVNIKNFWLENKIHKTIDLYPNIIPIEDSVFLWAVRADHHKKHNSKQIFIWNPRQYTHNGGTHRLGNYNSKSGWDDRYYSAYSKRVINSIPSILLDNLEAYPKIKKRGRVKKKKSKKSIAQKRAECKARGLVYDTKTKKCRKSKKKSRVRK